MKKRYSLFSLLYGKVILPLIGFALFCSCRQDGSPSFTQVNDLMLNDSSYFETRGLNYFVFSNKYDAMFDDSKISAVEIIHHGLRTATNGDVRLNPTPGQWDKLPVFINRTVDKVAKRIDVSLEYPQYAFAYTLTGEARDGGFYLSISTDKALPDSLVGVAGLNMEFFPPVFFGHSYLMDGKPGLFPTSAADIMTVINGIVEPTPMAVGTVIEIAPDAPSKHITIRTTLPDSKLMLFDGRDKQQNGTFIVRTLLPAGKTGKITEWFIQAETDTRWLRTPTISYSQVGYHPAQQKMAVIELDKNDKPLSDITLYKVNADGSLTAALSGKPVTWGMYTRYNYLQFDFSQVEEPGIYKLVYGDQASGPFPIDANVYQRAWYPTLDVFMPVQMDHMFVREAYRVWHGAAHLDDARQAPVNYSHWDGWSQGASTDNRFKPGQHIPGLNVGGWFDAGDFDIQTPSQQQTVQSLADIWEEFAPAHDETTVDQQAHYTEIHLPDGKPDVLQQIEHGVLQLAAQVNAIGYAIPGINESHLYQYRHLGDAVTKTDGTAGNADDRMAFTNRTPALNYGTAAALAASARVLPALNPSLASEALRIAEFIWKDEHNRKAGKEEESPTPFNRFQQLTASECHAAFELWRATGNAMILRNGIINYQILKLFPELGSPELVFRNLNYIYGCHPYHNRSFVSGVGAQPKRVAYGNNRADHSFIPGGIVPGIRLLKPDFPENRDDYQFHWSENEYVIPLAPDYIYLVHAVNRLLE